MDREGGSISAFNRGGTSLERTLKVAMVSARVVSICVALAIASCGIAAADRLGAMPSLQGILADIDPNAVELFRLGLLLGAIGGSFAFGVLALSVRGLFWASGPKRMNRLLAVGMVAVTSGGVGLLLLAGVGPTLLRSVDAGGPSAAAAAANTSLLLSVAGGWLLQVVAALASGTWWFVIARVLPPAEWATSAAGFALAGLAIVSAVGRVLSLETVAGLGFGLAMPVLVVACHLLHHTFERIREALDGTEPGEDVDADGDVEAAF